MQTAPPLPPLRLSGLTAPPARAPLAPDPGCYLSASPNGSSLSESSGASPELTALAANWPPTPPDSRGGAAPAAAGSDVGWSVRSAANAPCEGETVRRARLARRARELESPSVSPFLGPPRPSSSPSAQGLSARFSGSPARRESCFCFRQQGARPPGQMPRRSAPAPRSAGRRRLRCPQRQAASLRGTAHQARRGAACGGARRARAATRGWQTSRRAWGRCACLSARPRSFTRGCCGHRRWGMRLSDGGGGGARGPRSRSRWRGLRHGKELRSHRASAMFRRGLWAARSRRQGRLCGVAACPRSEHEAKILGRRK